jgi:serine/threonine-protein kinase
MYLLLSGEPVREHGSVTEQLLGAMTRPVPSLGDVTALPRSVVAVVDRALAFERDARFPDARSMQLAVRAVQDELSMPDSRATLPPPSLEPTALSLRTPRPEGRSKRPSIPTVRPVAATVTPLPTGSAQQPRSALPVYVTLGFAVGISIVVAARISVRAPSEMQPSHAAQRESAPPALPVQPLTPPVASSAAPSVANPAPLPSTRRPVRVPTKPASDRDPLSRRK